MKTFPRCAFLNGKLNKKYKIGGLRMKKQYGSPELNVTTFYMDIVTASSVTYENDNVGGWIWGDLQ